MKEKQELTLKKKILRTILVLVILAAVLTLAYFVLVWTGAWEYINSVEKIRSLILSLGFWGRFVFVFIQFLQVTFLPIPSTVSTLAGVLIYGPLQTALLSLAGIILGSVFAFFLGRVFGKRLVEFMVGKETCEKWVKFLTEAKYSFFVMMVLPVFPDDVLCLVAGLTDMSWTFFVVTNLISRPIGIFMTCYLGSGSIIPYHGWGLIAWGFIVVIVAVLIFLSYKYRAQIENFMKKCFSSHKDKAEEKQVEEENKNDEKIESKEEKSSQKPKNAAKKPKKDEKTEKKE